MQMRQQIFLNAEGTRMTVPVFEEYEPASDCGCTGCAARRRPALRTLSRRDGGHPAAHGVRRALVLATAAGVVLGTGAATAAAEDPGGGPQGVPTAPARALKLPATTRAAIIDRAEKWVSSAVPYDMNKNWSDGYRQDCSGYVSMAWGLDGSEWTGSIAEYGVRIDPSELQPGDILLFHNPANPTKGSHVTIFGGWTNSAHTSYLAYEETPPHARAQPTPYAYWTNSSHFVPYRYKGLTAGAGGPASAATGYPGAKSFGKGAKSAHVTRLGRMLVAHGGSRFYRTGPDPSWGEADRQATRAFQRAQGWSGAEADGVPGPATWNLLVKGGGRNIPGAPTGGSPSAVPSGATTTSGATGTSGATTTSGATGATGATGTGYPGARYFRPGQSNAQVQQLGEQLVKKGFGTYYTSGPGPQWTEADRRNVEAFQRAQGWTGSTADGYPGPETWRRLFG